VIDRIALGSSVDVEGDLGAGFYEGEMNPGVLWDRRAVLVVVVSHAHKYVPHTFTKSLPPTIVRLDSIRMGDQTFEP